MKNSYYVDFVNKSDGIFRLKPNFIARRTGVPGKRLRLHPDDYYSYGLDRGPINERWMASTLIANNGPNTPENEGLSYVVDKIGNEVIFSDLISSLKSEIIGEELYENYKSWPVFAKLFDNDIPLYFHVHLDDKHASKVGKRGKPEGYFFPVQYNTYEGQFPYSFYGLDADANIKEIKIKLEQFKFYDNRILDLSKAYKLKTETGWYTPAGVLHSPGTMCTYELQWASDVSVVFENITGTNVNGYDRLFEDIPNEERDNIDSVLDVIDWDSNTNSNYKKDNFRQPVILEKDENYVLKAIMYNNNYFSAKQLIVLPQKEIEFKEKSAYGLLSVQGYGRINNNKIETPTILRFGELSNDEYFVAYSKAIEGVKIKNDSETEPLVLLLHFANDNLIKI
ncbi:MAG: hypothetical protein PUI85_05540 [Eubacteriales bacterium]|nr:hypothetical protein [Eubacteriales bacterium]